jgi:hypothetical protein
MALSKWRRSRAVVLCAVGASAAAVGILAPSASAASSNLTTSPASPITINLTADVAHPNPAVLAVGLDSNCPPALKNGLHYGVSVGTGWDSTVINVTGGGGTLQCGDTVNVNIQGLKCGGPTNVELDPVVGNKPGTNTTGVQKQVGPTTVAVTVVDSSSADPACGGSITGGPPPAGGLPAAPGVANTYIGASTTEYAKACKAFVGGNNWRGVVISAVAAWMPRPESLKDTDFPLGDGTTWENYVQAQVDHLCSGVAFPYQAPGTLLGAHT